MKTSDQNFQVAFNNPIIREQFRLITGINATDNIAAFIGFINYLATDELYRNLEKAKLI